MKNKFFILTVASITSSCFIILLDIVKIVFYPVLQMDNIVILLASILVFISLIGIMVGVIGFVFAKDK